MDKKNILQLLNDYAAYYNCHFMLENSSNLRIYTSDIDFNGNLISFTIDNEIYTLYSNEHISDYDLKIISIACKNLLKNINISINPHLLLNKLIDYSINNDELNYLNHYLSADNTALSLILIEYSDDLNHLIETIKNSFEENILIQPHQNDLLLIVSSNNKIEDICLQLSNNIISELMIKIKIYYHNLDNLTDISSSIYNIYSIKKIASTYCPNKTIVSTHNLGIANILNILNKEEALKLRNYFMRNGFDEINNQEDIKTIYTFFTNNLNIAETARQLYVHRNTLIYRLDKYQKITNLDIRKFDDAVKFQIALLIYQYYKNS